jgi:hypothetical protein
VFYEEDLSGAGRMNLLKIPWSITRTIEPDLFILDLSSLYQLLVFPFYIICILLLCHFIKCA